MKKQILVIHGATAFDSYEEYIEYLCAGEPKLERMQRNGWKDGLSQALPGHDVYLPDMPCKQNAKYTEWKIWFEKVLPLLDDGVVLVGHSMGSIFLARYLSENKSARKIGSVHLVAAPSARTELESLGDFILPASLDGLKDQAEKIYLYFSTDDPVVPFVQSEDYTRLLSNAILRTFTDRGHFNGPSFPELVADIIN